MTASLNQIYNQTLDGEKFLSQSIERYVKRFNPTTQVMTPEFTENVEFIRITVGAPAYVSLGNTPFATKSSPSILLEPGVPVYVRAEPGWKASFIGSTVGNYFYVLELRDLTELKVSLKNERVFMMIGNGKVQKIFIDDMIEPVVTDLGIVTEDMRLILDEESRILFMEKAEF